MVAFFAKRWELIKKFFIFTVQRFWEDRSFEVAAELSYTSLLSLVPFMAVVVAVVGMFPVFDTVQKAIQDFIFANFVPAFGQVVQQYLLEYAHKATGLTALGTLSLVVTALMTMSTIDHSFNRIWQVQLRRTLLGRFTVYWAVLSLGPLLMGVSLVFTSQLVSSFEVPMTPESLGLRGTLLSWTPFLATTLALFLLYIIVPNRTVPTLHALAGALVAALFFEAAKRGFAYYVTTFPTYETIFGTLAVIPVFLIWIYTSWLVALMGAEIAHSLSAFPVSLRVERLEGAELLWAFRIVGHLWGGQRRGEALTTRMLLALEPGLPETMLLRLLETFVATRLIHRTAEAGWILSRDLSELSLLDLYRMLPHSVREQDWTGADGWDQALNQVMTAVHSEVRRLMDIPLRELYLVER